MDRTTTSVISEKDFDRSGISTSTQFEDLNSRRRRVGFGLTGLTLGIYVLFFLADALASDALGMHVPVFGSVGMLLVLAMFVIAWASAWYFLRRVTTEFAPLQAKLRRQMASAERQS